MKSVSSARADSASVSPAVAIAAAGASPPDSKPHSSSSRKAVQRLKKAVVKQASSTLPHIYTRLTLTVLRGGASR